MEFGLGKCATIVLKHGKLTKSQNISLNIQTVIRNMELDKTYKYLDIEEDGGIDNSQLKDKPREAILSLGWTNCQDRVKLEE
jgi:hypothetical protein